MHRIDENAQPPESGIQHVTGSRRILWSAVPTEVTSRIEHILGAKVVTATSQPGGFSEGVAARLELADGRRAFVKAVSAEIAPAVAEFHRREIVVSTRLPAGIAAPRLLDAFDEGGWVALMFEDIEGRLPAQPWRRDELDRVLVATTELADIMTGAPSFGLVGTPRLGGWLDLAADPPALARLTASVPGIAARVDALVRLDLRTAEAVNGDTLLHGDMYPFNILLTADRVVFVDWPHAWTGAAFCDVITLLSSVALSGMDPQSIADHHPLTSRVEPELLNILLASHSGFLLARALLAGPDADRHLVDTMFALGHATLRWLSARRW